MLYLLLTNLAICLSCFYLLDWKVFLNNEKHKLKFLALFTLFANIPFVNVFLFIYLLLNKEKV